MITNSPTISSCFISPILGSNAHLSNSTGSTPMRISSQQWGCHAGWCPHPLPGPNWVVSRWPGRIPRRTYDVVRSNTHQDLWCFTNLGILGYPELSYDFGMIPTADLCLPVKRSRFFGQIHVEDISTTWVWEPIVLLQVYQDVIGKVSIKYP